MNELSNDPVPPVSVEEILNASIGIVRQSIHDRYQKCGNRMKESPKASILGAVGVGYLLHRLPVRSILVTQIRVISTLAPPALLLFGAAMLFGCFQKQEAADHK